MQCFAVTCTNKIKTKVSTCGVYLVETSYAVYPAIYVNGRLSISLEACCHYSTCLTARLAQVKWDWKYAMQCYTSTMMSMLKISVACRRLSHTYYSDDNWNKVSNQRRYTETGSTNPVTTASGSSLRLVLPLLIHLRAAYIDEKTYHHC